MDGGELQPVGDVYRTRQHARPARRTRGAPRVSTQVHRAKEVAPAQLQLYERPGKPPLVRFDKPPRDEAERRRLRKLCSTLVRNYYRRREGYSVKRRDIESVAESLFLGALEECKRHVREGREAEVPHLLQPGMPGDPPGTVRTKAGLLVNAAAGATLLVPNHDASAQHPAPSPA